MATGKEEGRAGEGSIRDGFGQVFLVDSGLVGVGVCGVVCTFHHSPSSHLDFNTLTGIRNRKR